MKKGMKRSEVIKEQKSSFPNEVDDKKREKFCIQM